jgi:hypothetical protein
MLNDFMMGSDPGKICAVCSGPVWESRNVPGVYFHQGTGIQLDTIAREVRDVPTTSSGRTTTRKTYRKERDVAPRATPRRRTRIVQLRTRKHL